MEQVQSYHVILSSARELAKRTIQNLYSDVDDDEIMSHGEAETLCHCVKIVIETSRILGDDK